MQNNVSNFQLYIFFIDKSIFSLPICRYSIGKLMTEVLKMVKKCKINLIKIRVPGKPIPLGFDTNNFPMGRDFTISENLPGACPGGL